MRQRTAIRTTHPALLPGIDAARLRVFQPQLGPIETGGQFDLAPPADAGLPALFGQITGRRREDIINVVPDIDAPVTVAVRRVAQEGARHKLALPHCACPGAFQRRIADVPLLDYLQRRHQLG